MLNYVERNSIIHKTNSTIKLLILIIVSIYIFTVKEYYILNIILGTFILVILLSKIPIKYYIKSIVHSIYFVVLTFGINLIFSDIMYSFMIAYRIFIMLIITISLSLTTKSMDIVYAITNLLYPLKIFGVNTKDISLMIGIGINFMPILIREYKTIKQAQQAKGYRASILKIKKYTLSIFIPYITNCFKRVDEVALALVAKGYEE